MISEGPNLIEALPGELQGALNGALLPGEDVVIAVRGNAREALAATTGRLLLLREPSISGMSPVEVRVLPLASLSNVKAEPRPVGGRLRWDSTDPGAPGSFDYPTYDGAKYERVALRLRELIGEGPARTPSAAPAAATAGGSSCPRCATPIPADGCWCPSCGLQSLDPCWDCGRPLAEGANFCAHCGTPNTEPAVISCPACRESVGRGDGYCQACGEQVRPVCSSCDSVLRREWKFCPSCGGQPADVEAEDSDYEPEEVPMGRPASRTSIVPPEARRSNADAEALNARGIKAYETGKFDDAVRLFREATAVDATVASYFTNLGVASGELGDDAGAFAAYRKAVELNEREVQAYLNMGYLYMERERNTEACEMWERVIRLAPDSEEAQEARDNLARADEV